MDDILRIVTQNLNKAYKDITDKDYTNHYKKNIQADIYAFQEVNKGGNSRITEFHISESFPSDKINILEATQAKDSWNNTFHKEKYIKGNSPWEYSFRDGFWKEATLTYKNETIKIINIHLSNYFNEQFCFLLTKYLYDLEKSFKNVLLLGDFNTAEYHQAEAPNTWAQAMYHTITDIFNYKELFADNETLENPHHTLVYTHKNGEETAKKLDHIFVSPKLYIKLREWGFRVRYIDEVNINKEKLQNNKKDTISCKIEAFTDHSGIFLEIGTLINP